jgi:hypothetical protein
MGTICRIYERTDKGMKLIAQIRNGRVTGWKARSIRKTLQQYGFPNAPLEDVIDLLLVSTPGLGVAFVPTSENKSIFSTDRPNQAAWQVGLARILFFWKRPRG